MSDVRLVATNPEDSSLVPVACNSRGEMMIVEPTIEKISNDVEIEGDLTVTGTINGDDGGSGLPAPGPEGSILAIENGQPAWVTVTPPPEPEPVEPCLLLTPDPLPAKPEMYGELNVPVVTPDGWDAYGRSLSNWKKNGSPYPLLNIIDNSQSSSGRINVEFDLTNALGKVFTVWWYGGWYSYRDNANVTTYLTCTGTVEGASVSPISAEKTDTFNEGPGMRYTKGTFSWLVNRDENPGTRLTINLAQQSFSVDHEHYLVLCGWELVDPGAFALQRQIELQDEAQKLRKQLEVITTTDIDL